MTPTLTSIPNLRLFPGIPLWSALFLLFFSLGSAQAQDCSVSALTDTATSRDTQLTVNCPDAPFFKLSESPDFKESADTGVAVSIDYIDPMGEYADVSIRYPGGTDGGNAIPFSVTETTREVRVLAVLFNFGDGSLNPPAYATPQWVEKLVFSGDHDGRGLPNSIKAHIEQNSYGKTKISGEVYPTWVNISSIEKYRDLNLTPTPDHQFADEIVTQLVETDPGFFDGKDFDFLIALTPGGLHATGLNDYQIYSNWPDPHGIFEGWAMFDIPVDSNSQVYDTISNENRISSTETIVVPRYNPYFVEGVWLASDTAHTGTNYYTGGRVRYDVANPNYFAHFIELGIPLPTADTEVVISYYPRANIRLTDEQMALAPPDTLPETFNNGHMMHELYHGMGWLLTPNGQTIGDLYHNPQQLIEPYDLMASGAWNNVEVGDIRYYVPGNLSAYSKVNLDIVHPFTLQYGENEIGVRLYRAEEGDFANTNNKVKVIKVPLHPPTDSGYRMLVGYPEVEMPFGGEEYLLLEWRYGGELENGAYNFDEALPHEGLMTYRVIEGDPYSHGNMNQNSVRVIDATPAVFPIETLEEFRLEEAYSLESSAAPFGDVSGVYEYVAAAARNWKAGNTTYADFLLSPGSGSKTIYARFMDLNGQVVSESSVMIDLVEEQNTAPVADAGDDQTLIDNGDSLEWVALDGGLSYDPDGTVVDYQWYKGGTMIAEGVAPQVSLELGTHIIELIVYDDLGANDSSEVQVTILADNMVPVADAGGDIAVTDADMDDAESVFLDGSNSFDADGAIVSYDWYEGDIHLAHGASATVRFGLGSHHVTLSVTDDDGQISSDSLVVEIVEGGLPTPAGLTVTLAGSTVSLSWSDNGGIGDGFYIERGTKVKNKIVYSRVAQTNANMMTYDETLPAGSYYFRVQAFGTHTVSDYSNPVQVRVKR